MKSFGNLTREDLRHNYVTGNYTNRKLRIDKNNNRVCSNSRGNNEKKRKNDYFANSMSKIGKSMNATQKKYKSANKFNEFSFNTNFSSTGNIAPEINIIQVKNFNTNNNFINSNNTKQINYVQPDNSSEFNWNKKNICFNNNGLNFIISKTFN